MWELLSKRKWHVFWLTVYRYDANYLKRVLLFFQLLFANYPVCVLFNVYLAVNVAERLYSW